MGKSKVTDYMIDYMKKNRISTSEMAAEVGILEGKMQEGYAEPLLADEFLALCVRLRLRPEEVATAIRDFE